MSCCVVIVVCTDITMDCWKTQFVTGCGSQASASRVFISSDDKACTSGRVECSAESAIIDCNVKPHLDLVDLSSVDDEIVVVSSSACPICINNIIFASSTNYTDTSTKLTIPIRALTLLPVGDLNPPPPLFSSSLTLSL